MDKLLAGLLFNTAQQLTKLLIKYVERKVSGENVADKVKEAINEPNRKIGASKLNDLFK